MTTASETWTLSISAADVERARRTGSPVSVSPADATALAEQMPGGTPRRSYTPPSVYLSGGEVQTDHNDRLRPSQWFGSYGRIGRMQEMGREWAVVQAASLAWRLSVLSREWRIDPPRGGDSTDLAIAEFARTAIDHHFLGGGGGMLGLLTMFSGLPLEGFVLGQPYYPAVSALQVRDESGRLLLDGAQVLQLAPIRPEMVNDWIPRVGRHGQREWGVEVYDVGGDRVHGRSGSWSRGGNLVEFRPDQLVHSRFLPQGDDPSPYGLLRAAYAPWQTWRTLSKLQINGWQKAAFGVPQIVIGPDANPAERATVNDIVSNLRVGGTVEFSLPPGYSIQWHEVPFRAGDIDQTKRDLAKDVLAGMFAQHVGTGRDNGTQALHGSQASEFYGLAEVVCRQIVQTLCHGPTRTAPLKRVVVLNFAGVEQFPALSYGPPPISDVSALVDALTRASEAGALTLDGSVEDAVRDALQLPEMPMETREQWRARLENSTPPEVQASGVDGDGATGPTPGPPASGGEAMATEGDEDSERDGEDAGAVAASEPVALREPLDSSRLDGDRILTGPRGRLARPLESVVRFSETRGATSAGKAELARVIGRWREETASKYAELLSRQADTLGDVANISVPGEAELIEDIKVVLRQSYRAGQRSAENELERLEADPELRERVERGELETSADDRGATALAEESFTPPAAVQRAAQKALRVRAEKPPSQRGMTATEVARARDLSNGRPVTPDALRRMMSFFARHGADKDGATWDDQGKGWQAWHGWGGDAGRRWAESVVACEDASAAAECCSDHALEARSLAHRIWSVEGVALQGGRGRRRVRKPDAPAGLPESDLDDIEPETAIDSVARTTAASMVARLRNRAQSVLQAAGLAGALPSAAAILRRVADAIRELSSGVESNQAQGDVNTVFGLGRQQQQRAEGVERYMFSNLLESDTCDACAEFDGTVFGADRLDFFATPFADCEGGDRCNCLVLGLPPGSEG